MARPFPPPLPLMARPLVEDFFYFASFLIIADCSEKVVFLMFDIITMFIIANVQQRETRCLDFLLKLLSFIITADCSEKVVSLMFVQRPQMSSSSPNPLTPSPASPGGTAPRCRLQLFHWAFRSTPALPAGRLMLSKLVDFLKIIDVSSMGEYIIILHSQQRLKKKYKFNFCLKNYLNVFFADRQLAKVKYCYVSRERNVFVVQYIYIKLRSRRITYICTLWNKGKTHCIPRNIKQEYFNLSCLALVNFY